MKKVEKTGFLKQAPNLFTSFCVILKNGGERRAHRKFELRERCIERFNYNQMFFLFLSYVTLICTKPYEQNFLFIRFLNIRPYVKHKKYYKKCKWPHLRKFLCFALCYVFLCATTKVREWMKIGPYVIKLHKREPG